MEFVNLILLPPPSKSYCYEDASSISMCILGRFLIDDVSFDTSSFKEWGLTNKWKNTETNGNITFLEKKENVILLSDLFSEEEIPTVLSLTYQQYEQILTDWEEKVLKLKPREVLIKYENDEFVMKTKN